MKDSLSETQKTIIQDIKNLSYKELCVLWLTAPAGHPYFDATLPYFEVFSDRLFNTFGGIKSEMHKTIMQEIEKKERT